MPFPYAHSIKARFQTWWHSNLKLRPKRHEANVHEMSAAVGKILEELNKWPGFARTKHRPHCSALQGLCQAFIALHTALDLFDKRLHAFFDSRPE